MKKLLSVLLAMILAFSVAAVATAEETTLTFWFTSLVGEKERELPQEEWKISKICKEFEESHPGVKIDAMFQADQQVAQNKLRASVLAGDAPDIANVYGFYFVTALSDIFLDITDMIPAEDLEQIGGWATADVDGRYFGYPVYLNEACVIMYNKEIVANAGVDLEGEGAPKNAEEFMEACEKIKATGKEVFVSGHNGFNPIYVFGFSSWWSQISGVNRITTDSLAETKFADDEGFLKSMQFAADMYAKGYINADYEACTDDTARFINGEGAFYIGSCINPDVYEAMGDNMGIYMLPDYDADVANPGMMIGGAGQAACVLKTCKNPELAVEFLSFLNNHDNTVSIVAGSGLALRKDVTPAELGYEGDAVYERYLNMVNEHSFAWNDNSMQGDVANEFYKLSCMALTNQISVEECAAQLDQLAEDVAENS